MILLAKFFFFLEICTARLSHAVDIVFLLIYKLFMCLSEQFIYWAKQ